MDNNGVVMMHPLNYLTLGDAPIFHPALMTYITIPIRQLLHFQKPHGDMPAEINMHLNFSVDASEKVACLSKMA